MTSTALKNLNDKLKNLPDNLVNEVDGFIDYLTFKHSKESNKIPEWHKEEVLKRIKDPQNPANAFEMLDEVELTK